MKKQLINNSFLGVPFVPFISRPECSTNFKYTKSSQVRILPGEPFFSKKIKSPFGLFYFIYQCKVTICYIYEIYIEAISILTFWFLQFFYIIPIIRIIKYGPESNSWRFAHRSCIYIFSDMCGLLVLWFLDWF